MMQIKQSFFSGAWAERDGQTFAHKVNGAWKLLPDGSDNVMKLSHDQAFKMWDKHFNGKPVFELPEVLQEATCAKVKYVYFTRNGIVHIEKEDF